MIRKVMKSFILIFTISFSFLASMAYPNSFSKHYKKEMALTQQLKDCTGPSIEWRHCKGTKTVGESLVYIGAFLNGQPHGWGIQTNIKTETMFSGLFFKGKIIGAHAKLEFRSGISK